MGNGLTVQALTLTEPWASLVAAGTKRIETRSWSRDVRQGTVIAIHAAKKMTKADRDFAVFNAADGLAPPLREHVRSGPSVRDAFPTTRGRVIALTTILDIVRTESLYWWTQSLYNFDVSRERYTAPAFELDLGNFEPGRYAWLLGPVIAIPPVEATGALGLWDWKVPHETQQWLRRFPEGSDLLDAAR